MNITGNKVILREIEEPDQEMLLALIKDPEIEKVTGGYPYSLSYGHQMSWFRSLPDSPGSMRNIIADKEKPEAALGILILSDAELKNGTAEIYIKLIKSARGKGYGRDAVNAIAAYGFEERKLKCIYANILENNTVSRKLFERCGFWQQGVHTSRVFRDGKERRVCTYVKWCDERLREGRLSIPD